MAPLRAALLFAAASLAMSQFDTLCKDATGGPYSGWNETRCPSTRGTCCGSGFNPSGVGCCPLPNAVCCGDGADGRGGYACCPQGTTCNIVSGGGSYSAIFNCTPTSSISRQKKVLSAVAAKPEIESPAVINTTSVSVCKGGPPLPMDTSRKNVLWIGDSLSLGMIPFVTANLSDIALVQHAPWGGDGGAEETTYGLYCLEYFLSSPSGMAITPDLILFNWGMHDGPMSNDTVPGQNAPPTNYAPELAALAQRLQAFALRTGAQLAFAHTTPYICTAQQDGCVQSLNNAADDIMAAHNIPVLRTYEAVIAKCGKAPQDTCFGLKGCWCPHCNAEGYSWLAGNIVSPALRAMLV